MTKSKFYETPQVMITDVIACNCFLSLSDPLVVDPYIIEEEEEM